MNPTDRSARPEQSRSSETKIRLDAPVADVWRALTTGDGLKQWFGLDARDAAPGGAFWVSWGEGITIDQPVTIWEPNRHLRFESPVERDGLTLPFATDFILEADGAETVLRIVASGFGAGPSWDGEFDGIMKGWAIFATNLAHYLRHFPGQVGRSFGFMRALPVPRPEAWARLVGPQGFGLGEAKVGDDVTLRTGWGETLVARVDVASPPSSFGLVLLDWNQALLRVELNAAGEETYFNLMALGWEVPADSFTHLEQRLRTEIDRLFG